MAKSIFSEEYRTFLRVLVSERKSMGLKQGDVARKLHRPQSYLSKTEHGERRLDVVEFIALCRAMGTNPLKVMAKVVEAIPEPTKRRRRKSTAAKK